MTLEDYKKELDAHDWYYMMSDSYGVWQRGERERKRLYNLSKISPEHEEAYLKACEENSICS